MAKTKTADVILDSVLDDFSDEKMEYFFCYLDSLREFGVTNMLGSPACLQNDFGVDKRQSFDIFAKWTEIFEERHGGWTVSEKRNDRERAYAAILSRSTCYDS